MGLDFLFWGGIVGLIIASDYVQDSHLFWIAISWLILLSGLLINGARREREYLHAIGWIGSLFLIFALFYVPSSYLRLSQTISVLWFSGCILRKVASESENLFDQLREIVKSGGVIAFLCLIAYGELEGPFGPSFNVSFLDRCIFALRIFLEVISGAVLGIMICSKFDKVKQINNKENENS